MPNQSTNDKPHFLSENTYSGRINTIFANKGWCSWGWFEDVVLNTYFGFMTNVENSPTKNTLAESMRTQIRSFSFKDEESGQPKELYPQTCRSHPKHLFTLDTRVILPGKFFPIPNDDVLENKLGASTDTIIKFNQLREFQNDIDDNFDKFENGDGEGVIRNFVFRADFLTDHFGAGITTLEAGLNSFWRSVSSIYGGYWNFETKVSNNKSGRVMVVDNYKTENTVENNVVFPFTENKSTYEDYKNIGISSELPDPNKTFEFSIYGLDSIVSEFSVDVNLDSKLVTQAMYHSNKNFEVGDSGMNTPESLGLLALSTLQTEYKLQSEIDDTMNSNDTSDKVLSGITTPYLQGKMSYSNPENKLVLADAGLSVEITTQINEAIKIANKQVEKRKYREDISWVEETEENRFLVYDMEGVMHKPLERGMLYYLNKSTAAKMSVDPIVPLSINFTLSGIGGLTIGNMFAVDYLPDVYRKYALFQVSKVTHNVGSDGWKTTVEAIMRVNMKSLLTDSNYATSLKERETQQVTLITDINQRDFLMAIDSQLALDEERELGWWASLFKTIPDGVLAVSTEQAGKLLVELKKVEDELVSLHNLTGIYTIQQLIMKYELDKEVATMDIREFGRPVPKVSGQVILDHINKLYSESKKLRHEIFKVENEWIKPDVSVSTETSLYYYREAFSEFMNVEEGLDGLRGSGFSEQVNSNKFLDVNEELWNQYEGRWKVRLDPFSQFPITLK